MSDLSELTAFVLGYCERHSDTVPQTYPAAVAGILHSQIFGNELCRQAALYGYAAGIGATGEPEFDPAWIPTGCG